MSILEQYEVTPMELAAKAWLTHKFEQRIDSERDLYLFTWNPDPAELPHADFIHQHLFNVNILIDYLKACYTGIICVESTQLGSPHYHGWYQLSDDAIKESQRIILIKTLQRFGFTKISKVKHSYKIDCWYPKANALWYYKKDLLNGMAHVPQNPITQQSHPDTFEWLTSSFFTIGKDKIVEKAVHEQISTRQFCIQFYGDST